MRRNRGIGPRGFRFFASPIDEPRARRASDVLLVAATAAGLLLSGWVATPPPTSFETALMDLLAVVPGFLDGLWQLVGDLLMLWAVVLVLVALDRHRFSLVRDQVLATLLALLVAVVTSRVVEGSWPEAWRSLVETGPPPRFPALRLAAVGAGILAASPYLSRPARRVSQWLVALATASAAFVSTTSPSGAVDTSGRRGGGGDG
jgi:hypothetical protein